MTKCMAGDGPRAFLDLGAPNGVNGVQREIARHHIVEGAIQR